MARTLARTLAATSVLGSAFVAFVGCNSILDNRPGTLAESDQSETVPERGSDASRSRDTSIAIDADGGDGPSLTCPAEQTRCSGKCVSSADPLHGCGDPTCTRCPGAHAALGCRDGTCVIGTCDTGFADCNADPADGCETDLSKPASCGACNVICPAITPLCTPTGATYECTNGCTPAAPLRCGEACVDPLTSIANCGTCGVACPAVINATTSCAAGVCAFACTELFHACAGACVSRTDATACGAACAPCPVPPGGAATCIADVCGVACADGFRLCGAACVGRTDVLACGPTCLPCPPSANAVSACVADACTFACAVGFANCDANPANGCEAALTSDPLNCGACGRPCGLLQACVNGACVLRL